MFKDLLEWSSKTDSNNSVLWLYGPAGAGKSAIAQSFCQKLEAENCLGAIAYQLALSLPAWKRTISETVEDDPSIIDREPSTQLQKLIIDPCRQTIRSRPFVIVIDGLDECDGKEIQQEILRSIGSAIHEGPLSLRFFIASRPEPHIHEIFTDALQGTYRAVNINQSFDDVRAYLLDQFARIHREHQATMATVPFPWPSPEVVESMVQKSSGYFIYASTAIKFIDDKNSRPTERLELILGTKEADDESPFAALDQLYTQILSQAHAQPRLLRILNVVVAKLKLTLGQIEQLLGLEQGDVQLTLRGLQSVLSMEDPLGTPGSDYTSLIIFHHASFYDFLQNPRRAGIFCVSSNSYKTDLSCHILKVFSEDCMGTRAEIAWSLNPHRALRRMVSSEPSSDLLSLLHSFNPVWLFRDCDFAGISINAVLDWLRKRQSLPEDLIRVWQGYNTMHHFERAIFNYTTTNSKQVVPDDWGRSRQILLQAPPLLIKILRAAGLIYKYHSKGLLLKIHLLLDVSWNELRIAISPLGSFLDNEKLLATLFAITARFDSIGSDLTYGALRVRERVLRDELPQWMM
ncbi:NACHT domain-containing protein [Mycena sanguinolenta]|uniref:NACHT domain-containing protein n=1 Tax=Mycena sanguinolenta TaxID=230812 RepID=A0A8H6ZGV4_9AGAR|nr:NACHT domain-containing protein [Mycena sanguinolenta]